MHHVGVDWCIMKASHPRRNVTSESVRASVSFPAEVYEELERIAAAKKVSLAWVVRDAAEKYISDQWPLLRLESRVSISTKSSAGRKA
jgi:metal-responsive CopG/Arc/MetJ family transcriptional regulator